MATGATPAQPARGPSLPLAAPEASSRAPPQATAPPELSLPSSTSSSSSPESPVGAAGHGARSATRELHLTGFDTTIARDQEPLSPGSASTDGFFNIAAQIWYPCELSRPFPSSVPTDCPDLLCSLPAAWPRLCFLCSSRSSPWRHVVTSGRQLMMALAGMDLLSHATPEPDLGPSPAACL